MKASGQQINLFYNEHFPEGCYSDYMEIPDSLWDEEDNLNLQMLKEYDLKIMGEIIREDNSESWAFEELFSEWQKNKKEATIQITLQKEYADELMNWIQAILSANEKITATTKIL